MKRSLAILMLILVLMAAAVGCNRPPEGVLDQEEMANLMADIHIGESVVEANPSSFRSDSAKRAFRQSIYARHGLTTAQAETSLRWYGYNMERYMEVYDRVLEILDQRMRDAELQAGSTSGSPAKGMDQTLALEGDSVDVWNDLRFRPFASSLQSNAIPFSLNHDVNWEKGDIYYLRSKLAGNSKPVLVTVAVDYDDGTKETFSNRMIGDGWHEVSFGLDTTRMAREIYGAIMYATPEGEVAYIDSISLTRARWTAGKSTPRGEMKKLGIKRRSGLVD